MSPDSFYHAVEGYCIEALEVTLAVKHASRTRAQGLLPSAHLLTYLLANVFDRLSHFQANPALVFRFPLQTSVM